MADLTAIQEHVRSARVYFRQETDIDMVPLHFVLSCLLKYNRDVANSLVATSVDDPTTALCEGLANLTDGRQVCNKINTTDRFLTVYRDFIIKMSDQFGYKTDRDVDSFTGIPILVWDTKTVYQFRHRSMHPRTASS